MFFLVFEYWIESYNLCTKNEVIGLQLWQLCVLLAYLHHLPYRWTK